ncbi:MAG: sulfotransferase [gamma proteobacterium symbiont of Bathyaustriella thionipta]|nr:sulfotransferase [gamma proteobacterium symbiont of Bathyaustriella thionipta]MCU7949336.1 sulfotransferase [gamma proteobacterium symbiont of Bathyaustriella thionipta]MCU7952662.1 sulfotransferase [gamma proteobacterium symbiont of Bathyaustriella thionipta]MCU7955539.1 sulfotransferase [gamma proteobacterium symbiont of Bathyaustriella thionipta]MCU7968294.1 sulfotransferase [gamma proteobacterium symbiont of Bathyaustriella thionipta]
MPEKKDVTPVFIFSLPRAGSTLLQRIITTNKDVSSTAEPWVLLPFLYGLRKEGVYAEYSHFSVYDALQDLCKYLPNGKDDYLSAVRIAVKQIYSVSSDDGSRFFLDKTPRYSLISNDIIRMFPEGRFIFLWRNPLAIIASMVETFYDGKWDVFHSKIDLYNGIENLIKAFDSNASGVLSIRYEDLVQYPEETLEAIGEFLDIEYNKSTLSEFSNIQLKGGMGDPTGVKKYKTLSLKSLDSWQTTLASPWRKAWCRRYLHWLGKKRLSLMGYDLDILLSEMNEIPNNWNTFMGDALHTVYGQIYCLFEFKILKDKYKKLIQKKRVKKHD